MKYNSRIILLLIIAILAIFSLILDYSGSLDKILFPLRSLTSFLVVFENRTISFISAPIKFVSFVRSGEDRIKYLEQKNVQLSLDAEELVRLREENQALRLQIGSVVAKKHFLLPAKVLGQNRYMEILVDDPEKISVGQSVVYENVLIGTVLKTGSGVGFVKLTNDPDSKIPAKSSGATGIVLGQFLSGFIFDKVSKEERIIPDEIVLSTGSEGSIPPDLVIGRIHEVTSDPNELFQTASLKNIIDINQLKTVFFNS